MIGVQNPDLILLDIQMPRSAALRFWLLSDPIPERLTLP